MISNYDGNKPVYLGGSHVEDLTSCVKLCNGGIQNIYLLKCNHEEADDRIIFHATHAITVEGFARIIIPSSDTDIFVCLMYHCTRWMHLDLKELWMLCGIGTTSRAVPVYDLVEVINSCVIDILPAVPGEGQGTKCWNITAVSTRGWLVDFSRYTWF